MFEKIKKTAKTKTFLILLALIFCAGMIGGAFVHKTRAATATMGAFGYYIIGGLINDIEVCCNGLKLEIGEPRGGTYLFEWGVSKLYMWYNISQNQCALGDATPGGVCIKPASWPPCEDEEDVDGTIRYIGTTLETPTGMCYEGMKF